MSAGLKRWKPYPAYKDSGVEWLGQVPEGWEVKRLKYIVTCNDETLPETTDEDYSFQYVDISSVSLIEGIQCMESTTFGKAPSRARRIARKGDCIVSTVRTYLKAIAPIRFDIENLIVSTGFAVIRPSDEMAPDFVKYYVQSAGFVDDVCAKSVGVSYPAINPSTLVCICCALPPLPEQLAIAAFLDQQCALIDSLIEKKQRMVDLLDEKRRAVITQAVTRGLDPTVPMKDSGVEWLGKVPEKWKVFSLRRLFCVKSGDMTTSTDLLDEGFQVFGGNGFRGYFDKWNTNKGVIIIGRYGALCGNIKISPDRIWATEHAFRVVPFTVFNVHFMAFFLEHLNLNRLSTRAAQPGLNSEIVRNHLIALPPLPEQQAIADHLDAQCAAMDSQRKNLEKSIELLREYRASLITHAVTGKIDVRDVAPLQ